MQQKRDQAPAEEQQLLYEEQRSMSILWIKAAGKYSWDSMTCGEQQEFLGALRFTAYVSRRLIIDGETNY